VGVTDVVANLLLFAPLGAALAGRNLTMGATALFSAALSIAGEWTQLYSHGRFPATHDVICNVSGALGAARLLTEWKLRMARSTGGTGS
jgi:glycopeptide antibiotics resistance protein